MDHGLDSAKPRGCVAKEENAMTLLATRKAWREGRLRATAVLLGYGLLGALPVQADPPQAPEPASDVTQYRFEDHDVFGADRVPLGEVLLSRRRGERSSLIRPREHYVRELLKSVEAL
jgi:hypothetical protein